MCNSLIKAVKKVLFNLKSLKNSHFLLFKFLEDPYIEGFFFLNENDVQFEPFHQG